MRHQGRAEVDLALDLEARRLERGGADAVLPRATTASATAIALPKIPIRSPPFVFPRA
jgi:hypothetical protein